MNPASLPFLASGGCPHPPLPVSSKPASSYLTRDTCFTLWFLRSRGITLGPALITQGGLPTSHLQCHLPPKTMGSLVLGVRIRRGRGTTLPPTNTWPHPPFLRVASFHPPPSGLSQAHPSLYKVHPFISSIAPQSWRFPLPHSGRVKNFLPPKFSFSGGLRELASTQSVFPSLSVAASLPLPPASPASQWIAKGEMRRVIAF